MTASEMPTMSLPLLLVAALGSTPPAPALLHAQDPATVAPAPAPEPDPALVEKNRKLSEQSQAGDRDLIIGRVGLAGAGLFLGGAIGLGVGAHFVEGKNPGMVAGAVILGVASAGLVGGSVFFMLRGRKRMQAARRGELLVGVTPTSVSLGIRF